MDRRETERVLRALDEVRREGGRAALATVVRVAGSAYRREGARMLIRANGTYECMLSGGCLEPAVVEAAQRVIRTGEPLVTSYDLNDDVVWGLGLGCGGSVTVRMERVENDRLTTAWLALLARAEAGVLVTSMPPRQVRLLVRASGHVVGESSDPLMPDIVAHALALLGSDDPHSGLYTVGGVELFFDVSTPPPVLVVFGAGHDAIPVARYAREAGFDVTVVDVRDAYLTAERFPGVRLVSARTGELDKAVAIPSRAFVLVMNHHLVRDRESLRAGIESDAAYIGVLGPRTRYQMLLSGLAGEGYAPPAARLGRVRNPVGLDLGAETPEEVAVSVVGELMAVRRGFDGGFLRDRSGRIHRAADARILARS